MSTYWLKSFGSANNRIPDDWYEWEDGLFVSNITFARTWRFQVGDPVAYYAAGWQTVVAIGRIRGQAQPAPTLIWDQMASVELVWKSTAGAGIPLRDFDAHSRLPVSMMRRSKLRLKEAEAEALHQIAGQQPPPAGIAWA